MLMCLIVYFHGMKCLLSTPNKTSPLTSTHSLTKASTVAKGKLSEKEKKIKCTSCVAAGVLEKEKNLDTAMVSFQ